MKSGSADEIQKYVRRAPPMQAEKKHGKCHYSSTSSVLRALHTPGGQKASSASAARHLNREQRLEPGTPATPATPAMQTLPPANTHSADDSSHRATARCRTAGWRPGQQGRPGWKICASFCSGRCPNLDSNTETDKKPVAQLSSRKPRCPAARFVGDTHSGTKQEHAKRRGIDEFGARYDWSGPASEDCPLATRQRPPQRRVFMTCHNIMLHGRR